MWAGDGGVAVAGAGRPRASASDAQRTQVRPEPDGLLLEVGGSRPRGVLPAFACGQAHRGRHCPFWVPGPNPVQAASRHRPESERRSPKS